MSEQNTNSRSHQSPRRAPEVRVYENPLESAELRRNSGLQNSPSADTAGEEASPKKMSTRSYTAQAPASYSHEVQTESRASSELEKTSRAESAPPRQPTDGYHRRPQPDAVRRQAVITDNSFPSKQNINTAPVAKRVKNYSDAPSGQPISQATVGCNLVNSRRASGVSQPKSITADNSRNYPDNAGKPRRPSGTSEPVYTALPRRRSTEDEMFEAVYGPIDDDVYYSGKAGRISVSDMDASYQNTQVKRASGTYPRIHRNQEVSDDDIYDEIGIIGEADDSESHILPPIFHSGIKSRNKSDNSALQAPRSNTFSNRSLSSEGRALEQRAGRAQDNTSAQIGIRTNGITPHNADSINKSVPVQRDERIQRPLPPRRPDSARNANPAQNGVRTKDGITPHSSDSINKSVPVQRDERIQRPLPPRRPDSARNANTAQNGVRTKDGITLHNADSINKSVPVQRDERIQKPIPPRRPDSARNANPAQNSVRTKDGITPHNVDRAQTTASFQHKADSHSALSATKPLGAAGAHSPKHVEKHSQAPSFSEVAPAVSEDKISDAHITPSVSPTKTISDTDRIFFGTAYPSSFSAEQLKHGHALRFPTMTSKPKKHRVRKLVFKIIRRTLLVFLVCILLAVGSLYGVCYTIAHGPSETLRNQLVLSAMQASATKWVPGLFLDGETVSQIVNSSHQVVIDEIDLDEYTKPDTNNPGEGGEGTVYDEWADAVDGIRLLTVSSSTYKAYLLIIKDPSRVYVATSSDFVNPRWGERIFTVADRENAVAALNGGEFNDSNGQGTGAFPMGLTYSKGKVVWNDGYRRTFIGFDSNDKLVVSEVMTKTEADELGIRDAVSFQTGNVLIDQKDGKVRLHYSDSNTGAAQRTAIGQRADGAVIFLATDGRTASSIGATHNDVIDIMVEYGAVTAAMLDGGSSTMMYCRDYAAKYGIDESTLDDYQKQGMVNKYKAFTNPRRIPTYFVVAASEVS